MTFVTTAALSALLLVALPLVAHRLRRHRSEEIPFAAVRLVSAAPPSARRRSRLEHPFLLALRILMVVALVLLGASPLVRCSKLAVSRGGSSVALAIVVDDSMSMRAIDGGSRTSRFDRALKGAREILGGLTSGDAVALVLAGAPARVALAVTTDLAVARTAMGAIEVSDRATDLDGALALARSLIRDVPQVDRRVVLLSDRADGSGSLSGDAASVIAPDSDARAESSAKSSPAVWVAMPELGAMADDCGILAADRVGAAVKARYVCSSPTAAVGRDLQLVKRTGEKEPAVLSRTQVLSGLEGEVLLPLNSGKEASEKDVEDMFVSFTGSDAIAVDDAAPVVSDSGRVHIAIVGDGPDEAGESIGSASLLEQAIAAVQGEAVVQRMAHVPDQLEELAPARALIVDDPPGFTPEQRHVLRAFMESGGLVVVALGPRAAEAPLGSNLEPLLRHALRWTSVAPAGVDPRADGFGLGAAYASFADLSPRGRTSIDDSDTHSFSSQTLWADGAMFAGRQTFKQGEAWVLTLPLSPAVSDVALRPGFLALLDRVVSEASKHVSVSRSDVGVPWDFPGATRVQGQGPLRAIAGTRMRSDEPARNLNDASGVRVVPALAGAYSLEITSAEGEADSQLAGKKTRTERRVAAPVAKEIDFRPRAIPSMAGATASVAGPSRVDGSWTVALGLLVLLTLELVARVVMRRKGADAMVAE